jgi:hypothetical protein
MISGLIFHVTSLKEKTGRDGGFLGQGVIEWIWALVFTLGPGMI